MGTGGKILIGVFVGALVGTAFYLAFRKKAKPGETKPKEGGAATADQFEKFKTTMIGGGGDLFDNILPSELANMKAKYMKNLTSEDADKLQALVEKKERNWTIAEKAAFALLFTKWTTKKIGS